LETGVSENAIGKKGFEEERDKEFSIKGGHCRRLREKEKEWVMMGTIKQKSSRDPSDTKDVMNPYKGPLYLPGGERGGG